MKLIILCLNTTIKPSPISEGAAEIWINSQPCKVVNLTTRDTWAKRVPWRVATNQDVIKESGWVLPHPSAIFYAYASMDTTWVARMLSHCTPMKQGKVSSKSVTHEATKFVRHHISRMCQYIIKCLFNKAQPTWSLIDTGGGYHLGALNLWFRPLSTFPIQYSPLSPNCPTWSPILPASP
jgi:hypothetical protein